ncbi:unnamed protein product [Bursaphelenchus okinawaensis]|uniref:D-isomer specific 2-hydroxyacid dehydrogenase NAD-binding domain-containing protein n=1 Tax=Bursaphelenchus okinawaensis TaxID=465554 RepID=A0A811LM27_9BILA|nr:unnamed protein product [Bursaphelenchus okinawaensis]CAG9124582.1 unnamed protein product [Bursaphelenchus okinawaensis]
MDETATEEQRPFDLSTLFPSSGQFASLASIIKPAAPPSSNFPPFQPMKPVYAPSGYGRQILIYDSRAFPGCRREFAYKTRFTNQSGLTTVYYRCMACRALRHRLQRLAPKDKLPAVPCIAVKNDMLINDPDWPEASDHFCQPLTIEESNNRLKVTFERGYKRARMKMAAEGAARQKTPPGGGIKCEINESSPLNMDQWASWAKGLEQAIKPDEDDGTAQSTSSNHSGSDGSAMNHTNTSASAATPTTSPLRLLDDDMETSGPPAKKNGLDALLQLQDQREKSHSPDENLNSLTFDSFKIFDNPNQPDFNALFSLAGLSVPTMRPPTQSPQKPKAGSELMKALNKVHNRKKEKEAQAAAAAAAAFQNQFGALQQQTSDYLEKYMKNNAVSQEDLAQTRAAAEVTCSLILALAKNIPQASAAMRKGECARRDFMGEDLFGKTLAIIGLGKVGMEVAQRMQAFGMKVIGYDPLVTRNEAEKRGIKYRQLNDIWCDADYITLHCPVLPQTTNLINATTLGRCKPTVKIVNTSKSELIYENDLLEALNSGRIAGAALDTFGEDGSRNLMENPKVICTPMLSAPADKPVNIFPNSASFLDNLNATTLAAVLDESKVQSVKAATNLGLVLASLQSNPAEVTLKHPASAQGFKKALIAGAISGVMQAASDESSMNGEGIKVNTEICNSNELTLVAGKTSVTGFTSPAGTLISAIDGKVLQSPVIAKGTMVIPQGGQVISQELKAKSTMEYNLSGGGRISFFDELTEAEVADLKAQSFVVVKFN